MLPQPTAPARVDLAALFADVGFRVAEDDGGAHVAAFGQVLAADLVHPCLEEGLQGEPGLNCAPGEDG